MGETRPISMPPTPSPFLRRLSLGFSLAAIAICLVGAGAFLSVRVLIWANQREIHTYRVIGTTELIHRLLRDAQSGERGYILSGQERYLEPYNMARKALPKNLELLDYLTQDNPPEQKRINRLTKLAIQELDRQQGLIELRKNQGLEPVVTAFQDEDFRQTFLQILELLEEIRQTEQQLLSERSQRVNLFVWISALLLGAVVLLSLGFLQIAYNLVAREADRRERAEAQLRQRSDQLKEATRATYRLLGEKDPEIEAIRARLQPLITGEANGD